MRPAAARAKRVSSSNAPTSASSAERHWTGARRSRAVLDRMKNIALAPRAQRRLLLPGLVARLGLVVRRIEAGQRHAALDLADHPGLVKLVLLAFAGDEIDQRLRDHHRAVVVGDDHVARKDRAAAAGDRLVPADEGEPIDRRRRRRALAQDRQARPSRQPALSRITPSVTSAVTPRRAMRITRMSPKMPAVVTPMASATAMQPSGIASIAARVEIGLPQLSGVARSSRTGTKRSVKAGPTSRLPPGTSGIAPFIQQCRMPFFSSIVVMVAVVTLAQHVVGGAHEILVRPA